MEVQELDRQTAYAMQLESMGLESGLWQQGPVSQQPVAIFSARRGKRLPSVSVENLEKEEKAPSPPRGSDEVHIVTINSDGEIICPKCGEELHIEEEESEDDYFVDEHSESEDLDSDVEFELVE